MNLVDIQIGESKSYKYTSEHNSSYQMISSCSSVNSKDYDDLMDLKRNSNNNFFENKGQEYSVVSNSQEDMIAGDFKY